jgi:hypothetical protein
VVTRLCENYVEPECLKREGPETCINRLIDQLIAEGQQKQGRSPTVLAVAIAVPIGALGEFTLCIVLKSCCRCTELAAEVDAACDAALLQVTV